MGMTCKICNHPKKVEIDRMLCRGYGYTKIAKDFNVSAQNVRSHWLEGHVSYQLKTAIEKQEALESQNLLNEIYSLIDRTKNLLSLAEQGAKDKKPSSLNTAFKGIDSLRGHYELLSKIAISLQQTKLQEMEIELQKDGTRDKEEEQAFQEQMSVLNDAEMDLFYKLLDKLEKQDPDIDVVKEYRIDEEFEQMRAIEKAEWPTPLSDGERKKDPEIQVDYKLEQELTGSPGPAKKEIRDLRKPGQR